MRVRRCESGRRECVVGERRGAKAAKQAGVALNHDFITSMAVIALATVNLLSGVVLVSASTGADIPLARPIISRLSANRPALGMATLSVAALSFLLAISALRPWADLLPQATAVAAGGVLAGVVKDTALARIAGADSSAKTLIGYAAMLAAALHLLAFWLPLL